MELRESKTKKYKQIIQEIFSYESKGIILGLERIKELLVKLNNPEKNKKYIHISGTNGKGSVTAMCTAILKEAGYTVGMYTSPHLHDVRERIQINYQLISEEDFVNYYLKIKPLITNQTFFEIITAIAFLYFHEKNVDFIILEVGLGGEYDATNVIENTLVSIITTIELDHLHYLGNTREKIAKEKAGIIKQNSLLITGIKPEDPIYTILQKKADEKNTTIISQDKNVNENIKESIKTNLYGEFQKENALLAKIAIQAIAAIKENEIIIDSETINKGLMNVKWPGRMQFIAENIILDCAHNPAGINCLMKEIEILRKEKQFKKIIIIFGVMKDKQYEEMIAEINKTADCIILTQPPLERALYPEELIPHLSKDYYLINEPNEALAYAKQLIQDNKNEKSLIVVCGSCYLIGSLQ